MVAAYGFDEGSGTTVTDASGNGNNGTITNATWTTSGKYGKALQFNGTSARVTVPDAASLHLSSGMTLEAWVNPSTVSSVWRDVIYKGNDNFYLEATSTNGSRPDAGMIAGGSYGDAFGSAALSVSTWSYLAETYDGSTLRLYVNGTLVGSTAHTGSIATSTNPLQIGGDSIYGQYFAGLIDEVRVYNTALTAAQIQTDQSTPVNPQGTTPLPSFHCNLVAAPNGSDTSGNGSLSQPYASVTGLISRMSSGQVGCLRGGTYGGATQWTINKPGLTITSYPGERATVNGNPDITSAADGTTLAYLNINLNHLIPIATRNCTGQSQVAQAVLVDADNVTLDHNNIYQSNVPQVDRGNAIGVGWNPGPQTSIGGITISYNRIHDYSCGEIYDDGIYAAAVHDSQFYDNWIYNGPGGAAVQLYNGHTTEPPPHDNRVSSNVFDHVGLGIYLWNSTGGSYERNVTEHNVVTNTYRLGGYESNVSVDSTNTFTDSDGWRIFDNYWPCAGCGSVTRSGNLAIDPQYGDAAAFDFTVGASELAGWGLPTEAQMG